MYRTKLNTRLGTLATAFATCVCMNSAFAQQKLYRLIDQGPIGIPADLEIIGTPNASVNPENRNTRFAVNDLGEVVFSRMEEIASSTFRVRAYLWLPRANYNLPAQTLINLHDGAGLPAEGTVAGSRSVANAISNSGLIVGGYRAASGETLAIMWDLSSYTGSGSLPTTVLDTTANTGYRNSVAYAIDNASPANIVGHANFGCEVSGAKVHAFHRTTSSSMVQLSPSGDSAQSWGLGVRQVEEEDVDVVGFDSADPVSGSNPCLPAITFESCPGSHDPLAWRELTSPVALQTLSSSTEGGQIRGMNVAGNMVGMSRLASEDCASIAMFWKSYDTNDYTVLGFIMPPGQEGNQSWAEAVSWLADRPTARVVGHDAQVERAILWSSDPTLETWCGWDLTGLTKFPSNAAGTIRIVQAHAVTSLGYIVAYYLPATNQQLRACALTGLADITHDFKINTADLGQVLGGWGACPDPQTAPCPADLNGDGSVGPADLSILLSTWTGDDLLEIPTPSCESESESLMAGMTLEQAVAAVGFCDVEAFRDWVLANDSEQVNVTCQIIHYLMNN